MDFMAIKKKGTLAAQRRRASAPRRKRRVGPATPLEREQIVRTALALVDRDGLKALSMRRLGAELGADPMAIYYHLPNKQALLDAIVEAVMAGIDLSVDRPAAPPEERILRAAQVNALPIVLMHGPATPVAMRPVELLIGILRDAGLPPAKAFTGMQVIAAAVRGAVGMGHPPDEAAAPAPERIEAMLRLYLPEEFPNLLEAMPYAGDFFEHGFELGIRLVARGLIAESQKAE
jgi:AcrR family transcriptional regulator